MAGLIVGIILGAIVLLFIIGVIIWYINTKNKIIKLEQDILQANSRIDVYLTKRFDDLNKMVDTIKGYTKHEVQTLTEIVKLRSNYHADMSMQEKSQISNELSKATKNLSLEIENYPDLKADKLFINLQNEIKDIEDNLQAARSNYNSNVAKYNKTIKTFPNSLITSGKYQEKEYFLAEDIKREDVNIKF